MKGSNEQKETVRKRFLSIIIIKGGKENEVC